MIDIILRPKQVKLTAGIYNDWDVGSDNVLAVSPTGSGKSVIVSGIVKDGFQIGYQQAIIAHRNELVSQMSEHIADRGIPHRIIAADKTLKQIRNLHREKYGQSFVNPSALTAVVGVDTLIARKAELTPWALQTDRWIVDEAHHVLTENKWGKAVAMFERAQGLGVTATPWRTDGKGLGRHVEGVFDSMVVGPEMRELIIDQHLADFEIVCPKSDLVDFIEQENVSNDGDWSTQKCKKAAKKSQIVGDVVTNYIKYASGRQAICFATDVETAGDIANSFNASGITAASVSAKTPTTVRDKYIRDFKAGLLDILVNVDLFDEGFDVPACEVVIMARPTASLGKYRQMVGRALRWLKDKIALIIDHVSNVVRHGLPDRIIQWTLDRRDKRGSQAKDPDELDLTVCKHCTKPYESFLLLCKHCGKAPPLPVPNERTIDMVEGDLILLDRAKLEEMRQAVIMEAPANIANRVGKAGGKFAAKRALDNQFKKIEAHQVLSDTIAQWAGVERAKGLEDRMIYKKFYLTTGFDVLSALDGSKSRQEYETLTKKIESWYMK